MLAMLYTLFLEFKVSQDNISFSSRLCSPSIQVAVDSHNSVGHFQVAVNLIMKARLS